MAKRYVITTSNPTKEQSMALMTLLNLGYSLNFNLKLNLKYKLFNNQTFPPYIFIGEK